MTPRSRYIAVVGVGPGHPSYLTPIGRTRIENAALLVGASRLLDLFPNTFCEKVSLSNGIENALCAVAAAWPKPVAVLVSGDTGLMSLCATVIARFGLDRCEVIPGVSAVQVAFARVGRAWHDARIIDAHRSVPKAMPSTFRKTSRIAVLTGCPDAASWLVRLGRLLGDTHRIVLARDLTLATESLAEITSIGLAAAAATPRTIVLFLQKETSR